MGGFLPIGGGGLGLEIDMSGVDCVAAGEGLRLFLSAATPAGGGGGAAAEGGRGGAPPGALGAAPLGMGGALGAPGEGLRLLVSGSESYIFTPPALFRSFGIPPANMPPSCGADSMPVEAVVLPWSLLLLALFCADGTDGAPGGRSPGTGGAPPIGGAAEEEEPDLSTMGADRSLVTAFLSALPF